MGFHGDFMEFKGDFMGTCYWKTHFWWRYTELKTIPYNLAKFSTWNIRNHSPQEFRCWAHHTVWDMDVGMVVEPPRRIWNNHHLAEDERGLKPPTKGRLSVLMLKQPPEITSHLRQSSRSKEPQEQRVACHMSCSLCCTSHWRDESPSVKTQIFKGTVPRYLPLKKYSNPFPLISDTSQKTMVYIGDFHKK